MADKPPKLFLKKYDEINFRKRILSRTFMQSDTEYLFSVFLKDLGGSYTLKEGLSKDDLKKLKTIAKTIQKNTGVVEKGKLIVFAVIVAAIAIFYIFVKDMLLKNAVESGLTSVFNAKSEVSGLSFDIIGAKISLASCAIGDSESPMNNLIELGRTGIDLNMTELLKGKFIITNIECRNLRFGTKRASSAALAQKEAAQEKEEQEKKEDRLSFDIKGIDAKAILDEQAKNLRTPALVESANAKITGLTDKWSKAIPEYETEIKTAGASVDKAAKINVRNIKTIRDAEKAYTTVNTALTQVQKLTKVLESANKEVIADITATEKEIKLIEESVKADSEFLLSFIKAPVKGASRLFSSIAEDFLKANLKGFYQYGIKGIEVVKNLDFEKREKKEKLKPGKREGIRLQFPGTQYPNFMIENAAFSIGEGGESDFLKVHLRNISSAPDLIGRPASAIVTIKTGDQEISFNGFVDVRTISEDILSFHTGIRNYKLSLKEGLDLLGLKSFDSDISFSLDFVFSRDSTTRGNLHIDFRNIVPVMADANDKIGIFVKDILSGAEGVYVKAGYSYDEKGAITISARSNIDELLAAKVGKLIDETIEQVKQKLNQELDAYLASALGKNSQLYASFKDIEKSVSGGLTDVNSFKSILDKKLKELDARAKELEKSLGKKIEKLIPDINF